MTPLRMNSLALAASAILFCSASCSEVIAQEATAQQSGAQVRIVQRVDENDLVTLTGNTHPMARAQNDRGRVSADLPLDGLVLVLKRSPEQQAEFDRFTESLSDKDSPNYHQWLEPEEVGERYGPALSDIGVIEGWLRGHGLTVGEVSKDRMAIHFSGTATQVEEAFHTEIHNLDVKGAQHFANMSDPKIPSALTPVVMGPKALHNFIPHPLHKLGGKVKFNREKSGWERVAEEPARNGKAATPKPQFGVNDPSAGILEDVTPFDFAAIYNVAPAWNNKIDGTGQTIAIAGTSEINTTDLATFRSTFGLPVIPSFSQVVANGINPGECGLTPTTYCTLDDQIENSLDVEWSGAVAKGAGIVLVVSGQNSSGSIDTVYASADYVITHKTASILNVSYGLCELFEGTTGNASYFNLWQTASSEGIAVFVATGDSGSAGCDGAVDSGPPYVAEYGLSVSGVASTPYDTAVGGTDFNWGSTAAPYWGSSNNGTTKANALGYVPEVLWNNSCVNPLVLKSLQNDADSIGYNTPSDAEEACNFIVDYYQQSGDSSLNFFLDTVGGSGGKSTCTTSDGQTVASCKGGYGKPSWQADVTGIPSDGHRDLPDVSFFASNGFLGSAYLICVSASGACAYSDTAEPSAQEVGGTSVSSPAMAGVMALINQKAGAPQGNPNAELYKLASAESYSGCSAESVKSTSSCYFNDIDTTNNAQPCDWGLIQGKSPNCQVINSYEGEDDFVGTLEGYAATRGFDLATGLGSLNVANVVNAWPISTVPVVSLSPGTFTFANTLKGSSSAAETITLMNTGHGSLVLNGTGDGITITGTNATSFTETNNCGVSVAIGASCAVKVIFKPAAAGTLTASLSVTDNATGSPQTVTLTGVGTAPVVKLSETGLTFPATAVGGEATSKVALSNTGNGALALIGTGLGISIAGADSKDFVETNNCGASLGAGKSCNISVSFRPAAGGLLKATLNIADNGTGSPQEVALAGTGDGPAASLSVTSLTFASTVAGKSSATQDVTLKNTGNAALGVKGISIAGADPKSFKETNNCGLSLAAGKSCVIGVTFWPSLNGTFAAELSIADKASGSPQTVALKGAGSGPVASLSAASLAFPSTTVGKDSAKQSFTLTNKGNATLGKPGGGQIVSVTGADATSFLVTNTCNSGLKAGAECSVSVIFDPRATGALTAAVTITDNAAPSPQTVKLTGTGK